MLPLRVPILAEWEKNKVVGARHEIFHFWTRRSGDDVKFNGDLAAVSVERKIVDVLAERVLDLAADGG